MGKKMPFHFSLSRQWLETLVTSIRLILMFAALVGSDVVSSREGHATSSMKAFERLLIYVRARVFQ
jgi:hypothetical protein